jgi:hypothetical protein
MKPIIERVEKLLRLASPRSGTTQSERESAALEVVRLVEEHDLIIRERKATKSERKKSPPASHEWSGSVQETRMPKETPQRPPGNWMQSIARASCSCCDPDCGEPIMIGDTVWMRISGYEVKFLHYGGPCGW